MPDGFLINLKNVKIAPWDGVKPGPPETWKDLPEPQGIPIVPGWHSHILHLIDLTPLAVGTYHFDRIGEESWTWEWGNLNHAQRRFLVRNFTKPEKKHSRKVQHNIDRRVARMLRKVNDDNNN